MSIVTIFINEIVLFIVFWHFDLCGVLTTQSYFYVLLTSLFSLVQKIDFFLLKTNGKCGALKCTTSAPE